MLSSVYVFMYAHVRERERERSFLQTTPRMLLNFNGFVITHWNSLGNFKYFNAKATSQTNSITVSEYGI